MNRAEYDEKLRQEKNRVYYNKSNTDYVQELNRKADEYPDYENQYFCDEINGEAMTGVVTQPFFKSLELSKKRLDENGLTKRVDLYPDNKKKGKKHVSNEYRTNSAKDIEVGSEGNNIFATRDKKVIAKHWFYKNGKVIYSYKDSEISTIDLLKTKGDGKYAACPNCGHIALIATYTDGCDYCHSKFEVSDFDTKISGYSLKENVAKKTKGTYKKSLRTVGLLTLAAFILLLVSLFVVGTTSKQTTNMLLLGSGFVFSVAILPVFFRGLVLFYLLFFIGYVVWLPVKNIRFKRENVVKKVIRDFSVSDFCQNLEYKLKSIHMADKAEDVAAFANINLNDIVKKNEGIVDCTLVKVKFHNADIEQNKYVIHISCKLRLIIFNDGKLKRKYEKLKLKMSLDQSVSMKRIGGIRSYRCPDCGGNIDLLNGGKCDYCGHRMDYSMYDWMIEDYVSDIMKVSDYGKIRYGIIAFYIMVLAVTFMQHSNRKMLRLGLNIVDYAAHREQVLGEIYGQVVKPDIAEDKLEIKDDMKDINRKIYVYEDIDGVTEGTKYYGVLAEKEEYIFSEIEDNYFVFYKASRYYDEDMYIKIYVTFDENTVRIEFNLADKVGE